MSKQLLKIGELADRVGVSADTLRYYEQHGLLQPAQRSSAGYRMYDFASVQRLHFILRAKQVGFTLKEIDELLALEVSREQQSCEQVKLVVDQKRADVAARIRELQQIEQSLRRLSDACCGGLEPATTCTILDTLSDREPAEARYAVAD